MDHTSEAYLSMFHDQALSILNNKPVQEFIDAREAGKSASDELKSTYWKQPWLLRVKATTEDYKGEAKAKITVYSCEPVDYVTQARKMLKKLESKFGSFAPLAPIASPEVQSQTGTENVDINNNNIIIINDDDMSVKRRRVEELDY